MPNWCENNINVRGDTQELARFVEECCSKNDNGVYEIDFDKVIPQPTRREDCEPQFINDGERGYQEDERRPWFNWYDWRIQHWGTKWSADGYYSTIDDKEELEEGTDEIDFSYGTAWSPATPILNALQKKYPKLDFRMTYYESGMGYAGEIDEVGNEVEYDYSSNKEGYFKFLVDNGLESEESIEEMY